jgi:hypothetical protein
LEKISEANNPTKNSMKVMGKDFNPAFIKCSSFLPFLVAILNAWDSDPP